MQLIITAWGEPDGALFEQLLASIRESDCEVRECRMARIARGCACFLLVQGRWNHVARLESALAVLGQQAQIFHHRLEETAGEGGEGSGELLYVADVVSREHAGVLEGLVAYFSQAGVGIQDLRCSSYRLPYVDATVCTIHMLLRIPPGIGVLSLRDDFLDYCEQLQVDAIFEPVKPIF